MVVNNPAKGNPAENHATLTAAAVINELSRQRNEAMEQNRDYKKSELRLMQTLTDHRKLVITQRSEIRELKAELNGVKLILKDADILNKSCIKRITKLERENMLLKQTLHMLTQC